MNDESSPIESMHNTYTIQTMFSDPRSLHINIDKYGGPGIKDFHITVNGNEFIFTKDEVFEILDRFKNGRYR